MRKTNLARDLLRLHGFAEEQIRSVFTGMRSGEKLCEEPPAGGDDPHSASGARRVLADGESVPRPAPLLAPVVSGGRQPDVSLGLEAALNRFTIQFEVRLVPG